MVNWGHIKARNRARLVQFENSSVLHWSMNGQVQLLKCAEKDEVDQEVIRANFVLRVLGRPSASRTQVALEEELGACIPTVVKGNIVKFVNFLWRDNDDGILHTPQTVRKGITL